MEMCARAMWIKNFVLMAAMDVIFMEITCQETETESNDNHIESTFLTEKSSRKLIQEVTEDHQVLLLQKMTGFRLQKILHGDRSFGSNDNVQWHECLNQKKGDVNNLSQTYTDAEGACSKLALSDVREKNRSVKQMLKQISEWRRGYKYLIRQCKEKNPRNKQVARNCLDEYVQKDNYDGTLSKLLSMLEDSKIALKSTAEESLSRLDACLEDALSRYLEDVRGLKEKLGYCYERKIKKKPVVGELRAKCPL